MKRAREENTILLSPPPVVVGLELSNLFPTLPRDLLHFIFEKSIPNKPRSRWAVLALLRLVCKRFASIVSIEMLKRALYKDICEFPRVCIRPKRDGGEGTFPHGYLLIHSSWLKGYNNRFWAGFFDNGVCCNCLLESKPVAKVCCDIAIAGGDDYISLLDDQLDAFILNWHLIANKLREFAAHKDSKGGIILLWFGLGSTFHRYFSL